ncbi:MAG: RNA methyltransferase [Bacteroidia bacterium]
MESYKQQLFQYLSGFISESRLQKIEENVRNRTRYLTIALEDIYQPHNASAVLRSAECLGIQDVHVIEQRNKYDPNPDVVMGANKWLTMHKYRNPEGSTLECIQSLKKNGYRIIATTPHEKDTLIDKLDIHKGKMALFFGTEIDGISKVVRDHADEFVKIPMVGFTESFNISVSAAICMYQVMKDIRSSDLKWHLSEDEKLDIKLEWVKASLNKPELLEKEFKIRSGLE